MAGQFEALDLRLQRGKHRFRLGEDSNLRIQEGLRPK
jgi:hypothetical protein